MGWLDEWSYRKLHEVVGSTAGAQTNYQIKIKVHRTTGTDSGEDVYVGTKCRADFGDIRFTKSDGTTLLDYWLESYDGDIAVFWVEVPSIPASPDKATIYIYYGNPSATTTSNGDNTFVFFDDFTSLDTAKWTFHPQDGVIEIVGSELHLRATTKGATTEPWFVKTSAITGLNHAIEWKLRHTSGNTSYNQDRVAVGETDSAVHFADAYEAAMEFTAYGGTKISENIKNAGTWQTEYALGTGLAQGAIWILQIKRYNTTNVAAYLDENRALQNSNSRTDDLFDFYPNCFLRSELGSVNDAYIDWVLVRKYVDPEPSHGSWGSEEQSEVTEVTVTDSILLSDQVLRHKTLTISDSVGVSDSILGHKTFTIMDVINAVDSALRNKTLSIADAIQLLDRIIRNKSLTISDQINLSDQTSCDKTLKITDLIQLAEQILRDKSFIISDSISVSDLVNVITEILKTVTDSIGLSDQVLTHKTFTVSDQITLSDQALRNKLVEITDQISLLESIVTSKLFVIIDQIGLSDTVKLIQVIKIVSDTVSITEQILTYKTLTVQDQINLSELITILGQAIKLVKILVESFIPVKIKTESLTPVKITSEPLNPVKIESEEIIE